MANLQVVDGASAEKYLKASGAGTSGDPHVPEHLESNSAAIKAALETLDNIVSGFEAQVDVVSSALPNGAATAANQATLIGHVDGVEALLTTMDADTSALAGVVAGSEVQVDVVGSLPAGSNLIGTVNQAYRTATSVVAAISASGDNTVVAGNASYKYRQVMWLVQNVSAVVTTVIVKLGSTVLAKATLEQYGSLGIVYTEDARPVGAANEAMTVNLSGANAHDVTAVYIQEVA